MSDRLLEQTIGRQPGLTLIFRTMAGEFVPAAAEGFSGEIAYELTGLDGVLRSRTMRITSVAAVPVAEKAADPALTIKLGLADFIRLSAGEADPVTLLMGERMTLEGDFMLAAKVGAMFGQPLPEA
ncbi:SCP2 sterol-binding domain-containing protein [Paraconexibacter antarcticus]|uniref:SCP2 sterol-binding domain-containing protein n=1 Tax=Paraconexibacter antarcticus TaxID=2949664 RepID=A0ABY5DML7_9ACTN|nr:SCP2 sterol-binding domain-containing protein [Paraconexibacter antarcticus]UTI63246.1 SCP2 sterol-binding domain-containing protein [Paraconexibacter antarcticus]